MKHITAAVKKAYGNYEIKIKYVLHNSPYDLPELFEHAINDKNEEYFLFPDMTTMIKKIRDVEVLHITHQLEGEIPLYRVKLKDMEQGFAKMQMSDAVDMFVQFADASDIVRAHEEIKDIINNYLTAVPLTANLMNNKFRGKILENNTAREVSVRDFICYESRRIRNEQKPDARASDSNSIADMVQHYYAMTSYFRPSATENQMSAEDFWQNRKPISDELFNFAINMLKIPASATVVDFLSLKKNIKDLRDQNIYVHNSVICAIMVNDLKEK